MNAQTKVTASPLEKLREPFPEHQISKLPKPTKKQTDEVKADFKNGIRCKLCGAWHHPDVVHLDYVGHAAATDRLLDADPQWSWEPLSFTEAGLPAFDANGGLWIRLTVGGVTRLGYGNAAQKPNQDPGNREKEVIGDAIRNAGMRFGMALDLWHKGDLHAAEEVDAAASEKPSKEPGGMPDDAFTDLTKLIDESGISAQSLCKRFKVDSLRALSSDQYQECVNGLKGEIAKKAKQPAGDVFDNLDDEIPY